MPRGNMALPLFNFLFLCQYSGKMPQARDGNTGSDVVWGPVSLLSGICNPRQLQKTQPVLNYPANFF